MRKRLTLLQRDRRTRCPRTNKRSKQRCQLRKNHKGECVPRMEGT